MKRMNDVGWLVGKRIGNWDWDWNGWLVDKERLERLGWVVYNLLFWRDVWSSVVLGNGSG